MHVIPPTCGIGLDDPLRCFLALRVSNAETERLGTSQEWVAGEDGGGGPYKGRGRCKVQSASAGDTVLLHRWSSEREVELNLSLLKGSSLPNTSCLASPRHLPLTGCSGGCLAFWSSGKSKKVFQDIVILPSCLITICCPRRPTTLQFAWALIVVVLWAMDASAVHLRETVFSLLPVLNLSGKEQFALWHRFI